MGEYEKYLENRQKTEKRGPESMEARIDAALDVGEAVKGARSRLAEFIEEYMTHGAETLRLAGVYRAEGMREETVTRMERDVQEIATMGAKADGSTQPMLLLDDLRIVLDSMAAELRARGSHSV